jgi:AcrR family transcriptional regulator
MQGGPVSEAPSKREQLRAERRQQILEAALDVFSRQGFNAAKVSDVAARAGVSQGTIYWYFESKEELLTQALLSFFDDFGQEAMQALEKCATASAKLRALGRAMVGFALSAEGLFALFLEFWTSSARRQQVGQIWTNRLVEFKNLVAGIIEEGVQNGEFKPVDAQQLVWAVMAVYDGLAAYDMFLPDLDLPQISETLVETLLKGLEVEGSGEASGG